MHAMQIDNIKLRALIERYANHVEFVGLDLQDINQPGAFDDTLLHISAFAGQTEDLVTLLECGAKINLRGDLGNTALHFSVLGRQAACMRILIERGADVSIQNEFGETAVDIAKILGYSELDEFFLRIQKSLSGTVEVDAKRQTAEHVAGTKRRWEDFREIQRLNFEYPDLQIRRAT
jgi:ankyrin repeat protein